MEQVVLFPSGPVSYYYESTFNKVWDICSGKEVIFITDRHVRDLHPALFDNRKTIVLEAGEASKSLAVVASIISQLLAMEATRSVVLVGVGGGVITDITGFVASIYMRGVDVGFIPTTILAMADAAIGGKNGVNIDDVFKNIAGTINQPSFIIYDSQLLTTLPMKEWSNGFAEVIKYACLFDAKMFDELSRHDLTYYRTNELALKDLIMRCAEWKNKIVAEDMHEKGNRKLLNFGHTAAHAIENLYNIHHGEAVAIGMVIAATLSEQVLQLPAAVTLKLKNMLQAYELPTRLELNTNDVMHILKMDKKRKGDHIDYILLEDIGSAVIKPMAFDVIENVITLCVQ